MLNTVVLVGRLTKDPELKYTPSGKAVAQLRLAVDRETKNSKGEKQTDFIDCIVWEKAAEAAANHLQKGRLITFQGRLEIQQYETQEGQKREKAKVVGRWGFLPDGRGPNGNGNGHGTEGGTAPTGAEPQAEDDDDVPF